jgi:N utilization substance protein A
MPSKKKKTKNKQRKSRTAPAKKAKKKKKSSKAPSALKRKRPVRRAQHLESRGGRKSAVSSRQSGDLEGLSRVAQADSESVDELVEEGNTFEAGAVAGVEEAADQDTREVHTHEVPEDDVPEEYLDKD